MRRRGARSDGANSRNGTGAEHKRKARRAVRGYCLWGRSYYRGQRVLHWRDLVQLFPISLIAQVRDQVAVQRQYWAKQMGGSTTDDTSLAMRLDLEHQIQQAWGNAHLSNLVTDAEYNKQTSLFDRLTSDILARPNSQTYTRPPPAAPAKAVVYRHKAELMEANFNCLSLRRSGRLRELLEDGGKWGLHFMCFQSTQNYFRLKASTRREWKATTRKSGPWLIIAWGTARNQDSGGVMIVLNLHTFSPGDIKERLDPPPGLTGRIGGLHLKRRTPQGRPGFDMVLSVGYAFQNSDNEEKRQKFWTHLQRIHTTGGG